MPSSAAALLKFRCRPAASNTSSVLSGGKREKRLAITSSYTSMNRLSLHPPARASDDAVQKQPAVAQEGSQGGLQAEFPDSHGRSARRRGASRIWQPGGEDTAP